jgi:RND family efflux transporter MFP subunit
MHISERPRPDTTPSSGDQILPGLDLPPLRKRRRWLWLAAAAVILVGAAIAAQRALAPPVVQVQPVSAKPAERVLAVTGRIRARESVQVAPRVAGQIAELRKDEGELVAAGDVLGRIDDAKARAALAQASAAADAQRRVVAQAERDVARAQELRAAGTGTQTTVEAATLVLTRGQEDLRRLNAAADEARLRLSEHEIVAPFAGRLLTRPVDPGQVVDGRTTIFELAPIADREVETEVDETYSVELALGQKARMAFPGSGGVVEGEIAYLSPQIDTTTGGRLVRLAYPDTAKELPVGLTVDVNIIVEKSDGALMVPRTAIRDANSAPYVQVVKDGVVEKRPIRFKEWPSPTVMVTEGLAAGDQVIVGAPQPEGTEVTPTTQQVRARVRAPGR